MCRDLGDGHLAPLDPGMQGGEGGQVVDVVEAFADRLEQDRERRIAGSHLEQLGRALPLLPQGSTTSGVAAGQEQRAGGALAEPGGEQGRPADLAGHQLLDLLGLEDHQIGAGWLGVGVGHPDHDAVVTCGRLAVDVVPLPQPGVDRQRPRCVHRRAVGGVEHQSPVAELIAATLDQEGGVARQHAGRLGLLPQVADQVAGCVVVETVLARDLAGPRVGQHRELAGERTDRCSQLGRTTQRVALPERQPPRDAGRRCDQHPVVGDVLDPPTGGTEGEHVTDSALVDHLLVQLAHPASGPTPILAAADQEDAVEASVGDGAAAGHRQSLRARPAEIWPVTRSQVIRGRSSANSSLG